MRSILSGNISHILFLIIALAIVLLLMSYLKSGKSTFMSSDLPQFNEPTKVIENKYYNRIYHFGISRPNTDWEMNYVEIIDSLRRQDKSLPILDNLNVLLKIYRRDLDDTLTVVQVGIIDLVDPRTPQSLAEQSLNEIESSFPPPDTVRVVKAVTSTESGRLQSAYYMIERPQTLKYHYPIWIVMFLVHNKLAYTVLCQVRSENYEFLRADLENILKSFRLYKS